MGNLNNPEINRWGLNLFWYRFWFSDKVQSLNIQQDNLIDKLISIYVNYGLLHTGLLFYSKLWNSNIGYFSNENYITKYFRNMQHKNKYFSEYKIYKIRNKIKNLYHSKLWILRYQNWLILNFYSFQPQIRKNTKNLLNSSINLITPQTFTFNRKYFFRLRLIFYFISSITLNCKKYYKF